MLRLFIGLLAVVGGVAAGGAWAARLILVERPMPLVGWVYAGIAAAAVVAYFLSDRRRPGLGLRAAAYGVLVTVSAAHLWLDTIGALRAVIVDGRPLSTVVDSGGLELFVFAAPPAATFIGALLWLEVAFGIVRAPLLGRRRRADSDLYGRARFLPRRYLRRLATAPGILLGQAGTGRTAPLIAWPLEGSALTVAPPRAGKGATIALNLLAPGDRGWPGSTVTIDPRGELYPVVARRRREMGRNVVLLDPFGVIAQHRETIPEAYLPEEVVAAQYNPLDWIRDDPDHAPRDINNLLDAITTPPPENSPGTSRHFYEMARTLIGGYAAYVRFREPPENRTLGRVQDLATERSKYAPIIQSCLDDEETRNYPAASLTRQAMAVLAVLGQEESGSSFSTVSNQMRFLMFPQLVRHTSASTFDPLVLADGDTDLFIVVPEEMLDASKPWLRLWITIPSAVAGRRPLDRDMLIVIDEMPRIGRLKPVIDAYTMAAGKGVHFWCFAQSFSALEATWGKEQRRQLFDLAEVVQILGFPRGDAAGADELSKAIGHATYESRSESRSGSMQAGQVLSGGSQLQAGENVSLVRERLVMPDELMTLGPDDQFVIASPKQLPRDALRLRHARHWTRRDCHALADPNPLVVRKQHAALAAGADRAP